MTVLKRPIQVFCTCKQLSNLLKTKKKNTKYIYTLIILLTLFCYPKYYSQENAKGLSLKVKYVGKIKNNNKICWLVKTTLINHSCDTLFYISSNECEVIHYAVGAIVDSIQLTLDFKDCNPPQRIIRAVPPSEQRVVDLEISSLRPVTSSFNLRIYLISGRVKNRNESVPFEEVISKKETRLLVVSKKNKIKVPVIDSPIEPKG